VIQRELELLTYVRLLLASQQGAEALRILDTLKLASKREGLLASQVEIAVLQALANQQLGSSDEAFVYLQEALLIGGANGYIRSFLDDGEALYLLLSSSKSRNKKQLLHQSVSEAYVQQLLELMATKSSSKRKTDHPSPLLEPLTGKEMILLSMLSQGASNKEIAEALGNTVGTVKVYLHRIYGKLGVNNRTQALLKAQELSLVEADSI
jgi:LuxR family maltose regulon positive regulatory protein